jgi:hypothetical protein
MMKRILPYLLTMVICMFTCFGSIADIPQTADGFLTVGEYASLSVTLINSEELLVKGGGHFA